MRILESLLAADHITQKELADPVPCGRDHHVPLPGPAGGGGLSGAPPGTRATGAPSLVCLTQSGVEEAHKVLEILAELDERICRDFDAAEMEQLYRSLEKICRNLEN